MGLSRAQSCREDLERLKDRLEKEIKNAANERAEAAGNISTIRKQEMDTKNLTELLEMKVELDHLKTRMEVLSNCSQSVASSGHSRLEILEKSGQDLRIRQSDLEKNMFTMIAALQYR